MLHIKSKLFIPPLRSQVVLRSRLCDKLQSGWESGLAIISAPAGSGKTTLVLSFIHTCQQKKAWIALEESDNHPDRFLTLFALALQEAHPQLFPDWKGMLQNSRFLPASVLLPRIVEETLKLPEKILLVLDDYHFIRENKVHQYLLELIETLSNKLYIIISSRMDPPWPLGILRAKNKLIEIRNVDLEFNESESHLFLCEKMALNLKTHEVESLKQKTEGWISGLQLAALSMQGKSDASDFVREFAGHNRFVVDYLVEEVLHAQTAEMQKFLLSISILDRFCVSLCDALFQKNASETYSLSHLQMLEQNNLFIVALDDNRHWYRLHHLFVQLLRRRLEEREPDLARRLHSNAARWLSKANHVSEAAKHALSCSDWDFLEELAEQAIENMVKNSDFVTLWDCVQNLSEAIIKTKPYVCLFYTWVLLHTGRENEAENFINYASVLRVQEKEALRAQILYLQSLLSSSRGRIDQALAFGLKSLGTAPLANLFLQSSIRIHLGMIYCQKLAWKDAEENLLQAKKYASRCNHYLAYFGALYTLGEIYCKLGQVKTLEAISQEAMQSLEALESRAGPAVGYALLSQARCLFLKNQWEECREVLLEAIRWGKLGNNIRILGYAFQTFAQCLIKEKKYVEAIKYLDHAEEISRRNRMHWGYSPVTILEIRLQIPSHQEILEHIVHLNNPELLSERELAVLRHLADGYSNKEIGEKLYVASSTVKTHVKKIFHKLDVNNRLRAISKGREYNLI